jgi:CTP synthase (UTP-ammonia lyase)
VKVHLDWVDSQVFEQPNTVARLEGVHGILVPGGFGERGTEGKIAAVQFAREHRIPFLGICFGMQMAVIEAARNLAGLTHASSTEFGPCEEAVVGLLTEWARGNEVERRAAGGDLGGTMRLGAYRAILAEALWRSRNATATGSRSTSITARAWKPLGCAFPACRPTASCRRSSNTRTTPGSSACSIIRS